MTRLRDGYRALVLGASGSLGQAWLQALQGDRRCAGVTGLSRGTEPAISLEDEDSLRRAAQTIADAGPLHLVLDATGALHIDGRGPEKRLDELDGPALLRAMQVNAIGPGYFATEMNRALVEDAAFTVWLEARTPARRWGDPSELVGAAVFLASDASSFVNGHVLYVDGGITAAV